VENSVWVDEDLQIIRSVSTGDWDIAESDEVTREITKISLEYNIQTVLIDHGKLKIDVSRYNAFKRSSELKSQFENIQPRVAFISPKRKHKLYQFFTLVAQNRGIQFKAFKKEREALEWLLGDEHQFTGIKQFGAKIQLGKWLIR